MQQQRSNTIDWESQGVLSQIADGINKPLSEMVRLIQILQSKPDASEHEAKRLSTIMLESSEQIELLINDILKAEEQKRIEILVHDKFRYPDLYTIQTFATGESNNLAANINDTKSTKISKADFEWLIELEQTIIDNIDSYALCVPWIAGEMATSERQIFRKIEKFTGLTPNKYIRNLKLHFAKELLERYTYSTVSEVASAIGLKDPYYFSSIYKKEFGQKPKEYLG